MTTANYSEDLVHFLLSTQFADISDRSKDDEDYYSFITNNKEYIIAYVNGMISSMDLDVSTKRHTFYAFISTLFVMDPSELKSDSDHVGYKLAAEEAKFYLKVDKLFREDRLDTAQVNYQDTIPCGLKIYHTLNHATKIETSDGA